MPSGRSKEAMREMTEKSLLSPDIGKHGKWKKTIERDKRRAIFDEYVSQEFPEIITAARPEYKLDQFIGKAPDEIDLKVKTELKDDDKQKIAELESKFNSFLQGNGK